MPAALAHREPPPIPTPSRDLRREWILLGALIAGGVLVRMLVTPAPALRVDIEFFGNWGAHLLAGPLDDFYARAKPVCDYLPGYLYLLWATAWLANLAGVPLTNPDLFAAWVKPVPIAADLLLAVMAFQLVRRHLGTDRALMAAALVVFNPGLIAVSAAWGQVDSVGAALSLASLVALMSGSPVVAALWAGAALMVKPQYPLFLAAAAVAYLRRDSFGLPNLGSPGAGLVWARWAGRRLLLPVAALVATLQALLLPFSVSLWPMPAARWTLAERMSVAVDWYPVTNVHTFNLWGTPIAGPFLPDSTMGWFSLSYQTWGVLLTAGVMALALILAWVKAHDTPAVLWACFLASLAVFELLTRMHERYLFMAIPLLATAAAFTPRLLRYYWAASALYFANVMYTYFMLYVFLRPERASELAPLEMSTLVAGASICSVLLLLAGIAAAVSLVRRPRGESYVPGIRRVRY